MRRLGRPKRSPTAARHRSAEDEAHGQGKLGEPEEEIVGGVGAHRHERAGAERGLAGVAHEQVEPQSGERHDQEGNEDGVQPVLAGDHGDEGESGEGKQRGAR